MRTEQSVGTGIRMGGGAAHVSSARDAVVHMLAWSQGMCSRTQWRTHSDNSADGVDTGGVGCNGGCATTIGVESGEGSGHERVSEGAQVERAPGRSFVSWLRSRHTFR